MALHRRHPCEGRTDQLDAEMAAPAGGTGVAGMQVTLVLDLQMLRHKGPLQDVANALDSRHGSART